MENQKYITILVHTPMSNQTDFKKIYGKEMNNHIETELWLGREMYKNLIQNFRLTNKKE